MGEAKRRAIQGSPYEQKKTISTLSPRMVQWLPLTRYQASKFVAITTRGAWSGITSLIIFWIIIRFIGPTISLWRLGDIT
uniref:Uncharacterized protein n=1 Tax=Paulinella chromatophora TaxID=39717 RepID=B1X513_PAUCH|nr:hypothetical protein PCC_0603 [Paulinella chromatophora]ACB43032.1 hypothetical protein PCC_0603 [Paulinella chromatophora]